MVLLASGMRILHLKLDHFQSFLPRPGRSCESPPAEIPFEDWQDCVDFFSDAMFCPKCVRKGQATTGVCEAQSPKGNGNLNHHKRTPGNDPVVTNGCGAINFCFGFNQNDQCEVNQHASYCHPMCPGGKNMGIPEATLTLVASVTLGMTKYPNGTLQFIYSSGVCWITIFRGRIKEKALKGGIEAKLFLLQSQWLSRHLLSY
jgi:hypothetical protein